MKSVCIFCGSSKGSVPAYMEMARSVGEFFGKNDIQVVYGGASIGLMGAVADGALAVGGRVVGVLPKVIQEMEIAHSGLSELFIVDDMLTRKKKMFELSDGFLTIPGGYGTLDELFEALTWSQLGIQNKSVFVLNENGFFNAMLDQVQHMSREGFISPKHLSLIDIIPTISEFPLDI